MKKIIRLTENDLLKLVKRVINENKEIESSIIYATTGISATIKKIEGIKELILESNKPDILKAFFKTQPYQYFDTNPTSGMKANIDNYKNRDNISIIYDVNREIGEEAVKTRCLEITVTQNVNKVNVYFDFKFNTDGSDPYFSKLFHEIDIIIPKNMLYKY